MAHNSDQFFLYYYIIVPTVAYTHTCTHISTCAAQHTHTHQQIWDRKTQMVTKILEGHEDDVYSIQYDDVILISASRDQTVRFVEHASMHIHAHIE